jgi:CHAD domain-containing protein
VKPTNPAMSISAGERAGTRARGLGSTLSLPAESLWLLAKSLKKQWKSYRKGLKGCQDKLTEKAIHELRVGARRLLSTVELLQGALSRNRVEEVGRALKKHLDTFDDLRDTQVQLPMIARMQRTFPVALPFYAYLMKREARFTRSARKRIKGVRTRPLAQLIEACRSEVEASAEKRSGERAGAGLVRSIDRAYWRTRRLRARIDPRNTGTIHRTRIAFKHFRYMVETLAPYLPGSNRALLRTMHEYQTMMGEIQDAEVVLATLDRYLERHKLPAEPARHLREELLRRRQGLIEVYLGAADQLDTFWISPQKQAPAEVPEASSCSS